MVHCAPFEPDAELFLLSNHFFIIAAKGWIKQMLSSYNIRKLKHIKIYPLTLYVNLRFFSVSRFYVICFSYFVSVLNLMHT